MKEFIINEAVMDSVHLGTMNYNKFEFLENFPAIQQVFCTSNILSAFQFTSLVPFNPHAILNNYLFPDCATTTLQEVQKTPTTVRQVQSHLHKILEELKAEN